ncbi:ParB/RepB/Spo0J family partition protein [Marivita sp. XM-24bin2]|jgi:ParB family chromosome partitioning protein|uniref:ParB/RepB/Spo0J family partition protein n=1 Tax=unclassified Marivita TaxID=2632480 RepID=UPI000D78EEA6|nr:ParB/RepB/Spo0J family partition protein [Marivita sp. XM-24bin2]MCR9110807.1 ParB/RepB/Spo0J family partition protein [Paracoccaceae bacterium]PWL34521.1 MAG: chromosome partitioning protein ParB [Marivita sp. XM-24bin2]
MSDKKEQRRGLGRGLSALMGDIEPSADAAVSTSERPTRSLPVDQLFPNPDQPRRQFDAEALDELKESIKSKGVIQPLIVRPRSNAENQYEIVAGERRWRAAQAAGVHDVPVVIREFSDEDVLEIAIIENIQRADLNPIEEAAGYEQLMSRFGHTQEKLAKALGKSRSHIANLLRLLNLPDVVKRAVVDGKLSSGHARALITAPDPVLLAGQIVRQGLSVRETERLVRDAQNVGDTPKAKSPSRANSGETKDADTKALEGDLSAALGMKVSINHRDGKESGTITIAYDTLDDLDKLCSVISSAN